MRQLIIKGKPITAVRIAAGETAPEQYAANELAAYLEKLGIAVADAPDAYPMSTALDPTLGRDAFRIVVTEEGLTVYGGNGRGVIYGIYRMLEHYAGVRYFMPGVETLGDGDIVIDEDYAFSPIFEMRQSDWQCGNSNIDWCLKNGINHRKIPAEQGGHVKYGLFVHTMDKLTGVKETEQPCLSDPELLARAIRSVREILENDPEVTIISVSQNDNWNYCKCEKCAATDAEEGSPAGTILRFVNAVADDIAADYPDVVIDTLAYRYTREAPKITRPRKNVCVRLCSIECCFSHPLSDVSCEQNARFCRDILNWNEICNRIYIWDYVINFAHYIPTFPNLSVLRENMRFFAEHGVRGMYPEGAHNAALSGEFAELKAYLLAKLMWDPYMSAEEYSRITDEFLAAFYGDGWRCIRAYLDMTEANTKGHHMGVYDKPMTYLDREKLLAMEDTIDHFWDRAEEMAGDRIEAVRRSRIQWTYLKLELHPDAAAGEQFFADCRDRGIRWNEWNMTANAPDFRKPPSRWAPIPWLPDED
ncbi:MAG: DUF4838 domain-containing protein [Clostridia bacterium]|nr:DUF4838 domain-containing protein [Clostridia bacterium]